METSQALLLSVLRELAKAQSRTYWAGEQHCGADFKYQEDCESCPHFKQCATDYILDKQLAMLETKEGG